MQELLKNNNYNRNFIKKWYQFNYTLIDEIIISLIHETFCNEKLYIIYLDIFVEIN